MKLNWGSGIAIFYSCFVLIMIFMVIKSKQNQAQLVQENYYQQDLDYENFRQKRQNASELADKLEISYLSSEKMIRLDFPKDMTKATGKVSLFRPSNKFLDKSFNLKLDPESRMVIAVDKSLPSGLWKIKVDWQNQGKDYYKEEDIVL